MRLNGITLAAFISSIVRPWQLPSHLMELSGMTATQSDERIRRNSANTGLARPLSGALAANDLIANAKVTYAPLAVWKDFHWTCTVTSFAPLTRVRLD